MTSIICPTLASTTDRPALAVEGRVGRTIRGLTLWLRATAGRFWGAGSETPTAQALDAVEVPSFHR